MKKIIFFLALICSISAQATNYYYSSSGNNANSGLTPLLARQTLANHNSSTFAAGDSILFKKGDTFAGQLVPKSGSVGVPIIYGAYGSGAKPIISSFETLTGWTLQSGNIYRAATTCNNAINVILTIDGVPTAKGRYPNSTWLSYESHSGNTSITDNSLTGSPSFTGAQVVVRNSRWKMEVATISGHTNGTLTFNSITDTPSDGYGYFIQNSAQVLDQEGEWYISGGYVYMYFSDSPASKTVKISTIDNLISSIGKSYWTMTNIAIQGANDKGLKIYNPVGINLKYCDFSLIGNAAIESDGSPASVALKIENCTFSNINSCAVYSYSDATTVKNCTITKIGMQAGMGDDNWGNYCGALVNGNNSLVEKCTLQNIGYVGIGFRGNSTLIKNNLIDNFCITLDDGGGIYTSTATPTGRSIDGNIVVNGATAYGGSNNQISATYGIYLDERAADVNISNNTVSNMPSGGILLHVATDVDITGNTVYNCAKQLYFSNNQAGYPAMATVNVNNNIFVAKEASQNVFTFYSIYNDLTFGSASSNVYARPISDTQVFSVDPYNGSATTYDLAGWKAVSGYDANSTKSPKAISTTADIDFAYNATSIETSVSLAFAGISPSGSRVLQTTTLQPYTSVIVIKDLTNPTGNLKALKTADGKRLKTADGLILGGF
ncbi:MAG: right-handed parallel beta-helix repeat-containing protein [Prolixibacteraceae bacterium]|nr:right-handed parallel beta-helix repeat-containing protein [Prolixibacteraceae bacterium]